jgi:hypothetical protein
MQRYGTTKNQNRMFLTAMTSRALSAGATKNIHDARYDSERVTASLIVIGNKIMTI